MTGRARVLVLAVVTSVLAAATGTAHAIERQHHIGLGPSLAVLAIDKKSTPSTGIGGGLHYTYGLNDQFNLMVELSSSIVAANQQQDTPEAPRNRPAGVDHGAVGVGYVIDILRWVPYLGLLGGVYRLSGGTLPEALVLPGVEIAIGLDYQLSRHWAIGVAGREHLFVSKLGTYPSYTTVLFRLEYMWGF